MSEMNKNNEMSDKRDISGKARDLLPELLEREADSASDPTSGGMSRRQALKAMALGGVGTLAGGALLSGGATGCSKAPESASLSAAGTPLPGPIVDPLRAAPGQEALRSWKRQFFTSHEYETIRQLCNLILPADEHSGNAEDANVPNFIDFIMTEYPSDRVAMRGGLRWLDLRCVRDYGQQFIACRDEQKTDLLDKIAWPSEVEPGYEAGAMFFTLVRNYTSTGFWSSKMGMQDIGYIGNVPNHWMGPPESELRRLGVIG